MMNPDRSLKMDKSNKKPNELISKNKSLSSPSNNGIDVKNLFKKQKVTKTEKIINTNQKNINSKLNTTKHKT